MKLNNFLKKLLLASLWVSSICAQTNGDIRLNLKNDKEVVITSFKKKEIKRISEKFTDLQKKKQITEIFFQSIENFLNQDDKHCELRLIDLIKKNFEKTGIETSEKALEDIFKMLRVDNAIDDIFFDILSGINKDFSHLGDLKINKKPHRIVLPRKKLLAKNNIKELFSGFTEWPDESNRCVYQEYIFIKKHIINKEDKVSEKESDLKFLIHRAYKESVFDLPTFNKLEYLRSKSFVNERNYWLNDYFKVIFNAKNKMRPLKATYNIKNLAEESSFSTERIKRFSRITRRKQLYKKYDETQIILLAQILQKASRRMGVDPDTITNPPILSQEFQILNDSGDRETYVERIELDPQSQYNLARRLLRKDMTELQMMETFIGVKITHEDIVMAALETGYISLEDIEYVVKYDDLWNPEISGFERVVGFVATVSGYGTFFLPPPWNITTSIAIGVVEGLILNTRRNGADNDNPATFIE
jgi:hypothetical protein